MNAGGVRRRSAVRSADNLSRRAGQKNPAAAARIFDLLGQGAIGPHLSRRAGQKNLAGLTRISALPGHGRCVNRRHLDSPRSPKKSSIDSHFLCGGVPLRANGGWASARAERCHHRAVAAGPGPAAGRATAHRLASPRLAGAIHGAGNRQAARSGGCSELPTTPSERVKAAARPGSRHKQPTAGLSLRLHWRPACFANPHCNVRPAGGRTGVQEGRSRQTPMDLR